MNERTNGAREAWEAGPPPGQFDEDGESPASRPAGNRRASGYRDHDGAIVDDVEDLDDEKAPARLGDILLPSIERAARRCEGKEKPIPLVLGVLAAHFGGGLFPGLHMLNAGTGVGKTQLGLQIGVHAAKHDAPVLYIGLELGALDLALRTLSEEAGVPWSHLWTGKAGPDYIARVRAAVPKLADLPFHYEFARPHGYAPSDVRAAIERVRSEYPEENGPGSRPMLVIVDFLQLVGSEDDDEQDLRVRIGRASYILRDAANRLSVAVLCISSIARERYKLSTDIRSVARLEWDLDQNERPINRRILDTDAIVGAGKESGEIEYAADSVSVLARVPETWDGTGCDVVFATAKGRATGAMWSPLRFTGYGYRETPDHGARLIEAWKDSSVQRAKAAEQKKEAKENAAMEKIRADANAIRAYVAAHQGCSVREARVHTVKNQARRWGPALALLGTDLVQEGNGQRQHLRINPFPREATP